MTAMEMFIFVFGWWWPGGGLFFIGLLLYYSLFCTLVATLRLGVSSLLDGKMGLHGIHDA